MADTTVQREASTWACTNSLPQALGTSFSRRAMPLTCGGEHSFAAVSEDGQIVGTLTTGMASRKGGGLAVGKINKIRADLYFLMLVNAKTKFIAATGADMYALLINERDRLGRIPKDIQIIKVDLPPEMLLRLKESQTAASAEVTP